MLRLADLQRRRVHRQNHADRRLAVRIGDGAVGVVIVPGDRVVIPGVVRVFLLGGDVVPRVGVVIEAVRAVAPVVQGIAGVEIIRSRIEVVVVSVEEAVLPDRVRIDVVVHPFPVPGIARYLRRGVECGVECVGSCRGIAQNNRQRAVPVVRDGDNLIPAQGIGVQGHGLVPEIVAGLRPVGNGGPVETEVRAAVLRGLQTEDLLIGEHEGLGGGTGVLRLQLVVVEVRRAVEAAVALGAGIFGIGKGLDAEAAVAGQQRVIVVGRRKGLDGHRGHGGLQTEFRIVPVVEQRAGGGSRGAHPDKENKGQRQGTQRRTQMVQISFHFTSPVCTICLCLSVSVFPVSIRLL